jgi:hypothetical protein
MTQTIHTFRVRDTSEGNEAGSRVGGLNLWPGLTRRPRRAFVRKKWKLKTKSPLRRHDGVGGINPRSAGVARPHGVPRAHFFSDAQTFDYSNGKSNEIKVARAFGATSFLKEFERPPHSVRCTAHDFSGICFLGVRGGGGIKSLRPFAPGPAG